MVAWLDAVVLLSFRGVVGGSRTGVDVIWRRRLVVVVVVVGVVVVVVLGVVLGDKVEDSGVVFEPIEAKRFIRKEDMGVQRTEERRIPGIL